MVLHRIDHCHQFKFIKSMGSIYTMHTDNWEKWAGSIKGVIFLSSCMLNGIDKSCQFLQIVFKMEAMHFYSRLYYFIQTLHFPPLHFHSQTQISITHFQGTALSWESCAESLLASATDGSLQSVSGRFFLFRSVFVVLQTFISSFFLKNIILSV